MKHALMLACLLMFTALPVAARKVTLTVKDIRSAEGQILVMVESESLDRPLYAATTTRVADWATGTIAQ